MKGNAGRNWDFASWLRERKAAGLYRRPRPIEPLGSVEGVRDGKRCLIFCSNDYLALAHDSRIAQAMRRATRAEGVGSGSAHLIVGERHHHEALQEELADFLGRSRALLFSTGYMANLGVIDALLEPGDVAFQDRLNHASLLDGAHMAGARLHKYPHRQADVLRGMLASDPQRRPLIATDGVFSMDGTIAPLPELARIASEHQALLMVDDAHGIGVLGERGAGSCELFDVSQAQAPLLVGTFGKALGTFGAFVAGSEALIEYLVQRARTYIFTTAPPPALAAATREALTIVRTEHWRRERLRELVARFRRGAEQLGLSLMPSQTPIQPLWVGGAEQALTISDSLLARGFLVTAIRPPSVPVGQSRLRITFSAAHEDVHVDRLLDALDGIAPSFASV